MAEAAAFPSGTPPHQLVRAGDGLVASTLVPDDETEYELAVRHSAARIARFNPVDPGDFRARLAQQSSAQRMVLVRLEDPASAAATLAQQGRWGEGRPGCAPAGAPLHGVVARVNVTNIVRGRFQSATLGYDALDPWAGTGWFSRALRLVVDLALAPARPSADPAGRAGSGETGGFGLHRVEANVQPHNVASLRVLQRVRFRREGYVERMLFVPGPDGREQWCDHVLHGLTREEWRTNR
ncbi:GNAT family N-acetyltransferase [Kytococcus sedentarius]|uniref:GNAT family N-acetyltransferase n=1 Tax=Kytococcus sedentarius TaxID=1276 RepID=UPI00387A4DED